MGLDMCLEKIPKLRDISFKSMIAIENTIQEGKVPELKEAFKEYLEEKYDSFYLSKEVAYWRKANQIHAWFNENIVGEEEVIDNCEPYQVTKQNLEDLLKVCKEVIEIFNKCEIVQGQVVSGKRMSKVFGQWENIYTEGLIYENLDINKIDELLPTQSGFFFGSTEYDQWYFEDIKLTIEQIQTILEEIDFEENYIYYYASW